MTNEAKANAETQRMWALGQAAPDWCPGTKDNQLNQAVHCTTVWGNATHVIDRVVRSQPLTMQESFGSKNIVGNLLLLLIVECSPC